MSVVRPPIVLAVTALLVAGCSSDGDPRVQVAEVGRATVVEAVDAPGTVTARATASVTSPAEAVVVEVLVQDGASVAAGDVLVRLVSSAADERLRQALTAQRSANASVVSIPQADLGPLQDQVDLAAEASFAAGREAAARIPDPVLAAEAHERVEEAERRFAAASAASRASLDQLGAGAQSVEAALAAVTGSQRVQAAAAVTAARQTVEALLVRAPLAGVVTLGAGSAPAVPGGADLSGLLEGLPPAVQGPAQQALGASGSAGSSTTTSGGLAVGTPLAQGAPLLTVTDVAGLTVEAEVDETDVLLVQPGTPATVEVDAVPGARYPATVRAVDLAPSTSSGGGVSYRVRLDLQPGLTGDDEPAPAPRPGMSAVVDLQVRTAQDVVAVPAAAVVRDEGRDAVFVVEAGRAIRRDVRLGALGDEQVEVLAGLEPGATVVVRDADRLSDGQAVRP